MKYIQIVTGASSGLGAEYARQLAETRPVDEIWLFARRKDLLEKLAAEIQATAESSGTPAPPKVRIFPADLAGSTGVSIVTNALRDAEKDQRATSGQSDAHNESGIIIDTLINNAGFGTYGTFEETPAERELDMIDLNVHALTGITHAALPYLQKGSRIINVASLAAFIPLGNFAVYAATKAYVLSFSCGIGAELADRGITVTAVCPGPVSTEFAQVASNGARKNVVGGKDPGKVVAHSLRCADRKRPMAIYAVKWKLKAFLSRFVGRAFFARHTYLHEKRPNTATKIVENM